MCKHELEQKRREVIYPDYQTRIREYNAEKQEQLLKCETQEEVERVIKYLRDKWKV